MRSTAIKLNEIPTLTVSKLTKQHDQKEPCSDHFGRLFNNVRDSDSIEDFETIYNHYYQRLLFFSKRFVDSTELAEEVVSDVFFKLWKKRREISISSSFQSYLYTAVRNRCLDYLRKAQVSGDADDHVFENQPSEHSNPFDMLVSDSIFNKIETAIEELPTDRRRIFRMSRDQGLKYKEIAMQLNISIKTVETQMGRSLKHIRKRLSEDLNNFLN
ncbi:MAG: RNA polymerase sigma-70 factor [Bacteroidota bacterium]